MSGFTYSSVFYSNWVVQANVFDWIRPSKTRSIKDMNKSLFFETRGSTIRRSQINRGILDNSNNCSHKYRNEALKMDFHSRNLRIAVKTFVYENNPTKCFPFRTLQLTPARVNDHHLLQFYWSRAKHWDEICVSEFRWRKFCWRQAKYNNKLLSKRRWGVLCSTGYI